MQVLLWKSERMPAPISFPQDYKQVIENLGYIRGGIQKDLLETYSELWKDRYQGCVGNKAQALGLRNDEQLQHN